MPFQFCPENDIAIGTQGCWNWSSDKPGMHEYLRSYFRNRGD